METELLPIEINTNGKRNYTRVNAISAPYMGAAEYEFGAPQEAWESIRDCNVLATMTVGEFKAFYLPVNEEQIRKVLTAVSEGKARNAGCSMFGYLPDNESDYYLWLSMRPHMLVFKDTPLGNTAALWAIDYARRKYLKSNAGVAIGDTFKCFLKRGSKATYDVVTVVGIPENDFILTVVSGDKSKNIRVPVWCCIRNN